jgi:putative transposase
MPLRTIDTTEPIELDDGQYTIVEHAGGIVRLKSMADNRYVDMHLAELTQRMVGLPTIPGPSPRMIEEAKPAQRGVAMSTSQHLDEIITGINAHTGECRPEYDLARTSQNERVASKVVELANIGTPMSSRTLTRKLQKYREAGASGLLDGRSNRTIDPLAELHPVILDVLTHYIAVARDRSTGTKSRLIIDTRARMIAIRTIAAKKCPNEPILPDLPSDSSMYRYIDMLTRHKHTTSSATTRRSLGNRPDRQFAKRHQSLPGGELQVDSTPIDVLIRRPNGGAPARPILTILLDVATRSIVAHSFRLTATKGVDHATLLAQALTPLQNRPDKTIYRDALRRANPTAPFLTEAHRAALATRRPFIFPRTIIMDNGSDYRSDVFMDAAKKFGVNVLFSAPYTPTSKPFVERTFGSLNTLFFQNLPGYVGRSADNRGRRVQDDQLLDIYALTELFDDFILKDWQNRPHAGLRDRIDPTAKMSPNQAFAAASEITAALVLPLTADDFIDLLPSFSRTITAIGVQVDNFVYDSDELHKYRDKPSHLPGKNRKWTVKVDPYNTFFAHVLGTDGKWIKCTLRGDVRDLSPHTEQMTLTAAEIDRNHVAAIHAAASGVPIHAPSSMEPLDIGHLGDSDIYIDDDDTTNDVELPEFDRTKNAE